MTKKPKKYTPCKVPKDGFDLTEYHKFTKRQFDFLGEYAKDLDVTRVCKDLDILPVTAYKWMETDAFKQELMGIHDVWRTNIRMTSAHASAKLLELMEKFERDYDDMDPADKSKIANALMRGADSYLRATGQYKDKESSGGANIQINIDLSGEMKPRDVDGEVVEESDSERT